MEKLHRQPDVTRQDYYAFVNELKLFHQNRGTPFRNPPRINGREIDLHKFYNQVTALGGLQKVIEHQKWDAVVEVLKLPKSCVNFALSLRQIYIRYLGHYEKIHFMGEVPEHDKNQSSDSHNKKFQLTLFHHVPMVYNYAQHEISDVARSTSGLNQTFVSPTDYDKICMSLLCGLPNEQELALNVCTILSNEGNYMLHLEQAPRLVDLLIAQAGVWPLDDDSLKMLYLESWRGIKGRDVYRFWRCSLDLKNPELPLILGLSIGELESEAEFLNLENDMGSLNIEGQRVLRVALILHNLSFEKNNVPVLVDNKNFIRFLLLSTHSSWANLKQTAYDTLANLASDIKLSIEKDTCSRLLFQTVMEGILSPDRFMNVRSMDILSQFCNYQANEDIIPSRVDIEVYQKMVSFLTVHDIMLLFYTLEALYALSDLGRYACDKIVCVHRCIGVLVSLLTIEPSQYGPAGHIKMKIVETMVPVEADDHTNSASGMDSCPSPAQSTISNHDLDSETFASNWLKSTYELAIGIVVPRNDIYAEYVSFCGKAGRKGVVNANVFAGLFKNLFPQCGLKKIESVSGAVTFFHDGLRRKKPMVAQACPLPKPINILTTPQKVSVPAISCKPGQKLSYSPILKAQLSAPPRPGVTSPPPANLRKCVSPSYVPISPQAAIANLQSTPAGGSSTLIKSLLANKVQQRNLQRQVVPQNVQKMVIYSPDKVALVNSPTTVVRCVRPGGLSQVIRTPLQARFIANKGRIIPAPVIKSSILTSKIQATVLKPAFVAAAASPRLNGVQRDVHMEVCSQDEDSKISRGFTYSRVKQMNSLHLNNDSSLDTKDSVSCDGDSLLSLKDNEVDSENFLFSQITENSSSCNLTGKNELDTSENLLLIKQNGPDVASVNNTFDCAVTPQPKDNTPSILKCVLNEIDNDNDISKLQLLQKEKICKKAPLLNGLLDKGKVCAASDQDALVQNGSKSNPSFDLNDIETKNPLQLSPKKCNAPLNSVSLNSIGALSSNQTVNSITPVSNSIIVPSSNLNVTSHSNSVLNSTILPATTFQSNGDNLMQICTGQTTLSGTIEVQPDQKGVVRLHIESPENSNQGSDLSSISDIARTLECASKAILRTNAECNTQVPYCGTCETTATVTVITTNTSTLARTGQQIVMITPALNQPQLHVQSPNIKFRILHTSPRADESADVIGFPKSNVNQLRLPTPESPSNSTTLKRPSSDLSPTSEAKKARLDTKTPLLEASLRLSSPVPSTVASTTTINAKPFQDTQSLLLKSTEIDSLGATPKLTYAKAIPVQTAEFPSERETKTFSGLSSASDNPSLQAPSQVSASSISAAKLEYFCEWKDCGLKFPNPGSVFLHASKVHTPFCKDDMVCQWEGCDSMKRRRFSLLTHLQDWHCNERVLHIQALRRKQVSQQGKTSIAPPQMPPLHPGYAPDAALLAIRRHALQYINPKELSEEKESALTKSIRLTSALILRNLVTHSSLARTYVKRFEQELAYLAMSPVESARTIAQCLSELSRSQD